MAIETREQVEQFILLQSKSVEELRALCESLKLDLNGQKDELLKRLISVDGHEFQRDVTRPQIIPLCTRGPSGQPLEAAAETMKKWRRLIFEAKGNTKEFCLINSNGQSYATTLKYIKCGPKALAAILNGGWLMARPHQRDLLQMLKKYPEQFEFNIVRKPDTHGNTWLMLHCEAKAA